MSTPAALEDLDWPEDAVATIIGLALAQPTVTADDLARELRPAPHGNMVGPAFRAAANEGHIVHTGNYTQSQRPGRKHSVVAIWIGVDPMERTP